VFIIVFSLPALLGFWPYRTRLQTLMSPDGRYKAELIRLDAIDRNYIVRLNGGRVYSSPDFAPSRDVPFRETLAWDKTGQIVVLEIARHRIFGYDAANRKQLSDDELLAVELLPDPPLWKYYFESEWPGVGRVRRPE
jgi:hypothetical protein